MTDIFASLVSPQRRLLEAGREHHVIACDRRPRDGDDAHRVVAVRWASDPRLGFPADGYRVRRIVAPGARETRQDLAVRPLPRSATWAEFVEDAEARRPVRGAYFPELTEASLGFLLPIVRLADARTPQAELLGLVPSAEAFFGPIHEHDAELAWNLWKLDLAPSLADLLAAADSAERLTVFYRRAATEMLLVLAVRFEYAALLGLGLDDGAAPDGPVAYNVEATWGGTLGRATSRTVPGGTYCAPSPPATLRIERVPGTVAHAAFSAWPNWASPPEFAPKDKDGRPLPVGALVPRVPSLWSGLTWSAPPDEDEIIGYGPVLYEILRFHDAAVSPGVVTTPPLPAGAAFTSLCKDALRPMKPPHYLDGPGMAWPAFDGHYHYEVRGIDLLGTVSASGTRATIRHFDDIPPASPRAHHLGEPAVKFAAAGPTRLKLAIGWEAGEDFEGPDVNEFRVLASFTPLVTTAIRVDAVVSTDLFGADLRVTNLPIAADAAAGACLSLPSGDFPIVSHGTGVNAPMRVRRVANRFPSRGEEGAVTSAGTPTPFTRIAKYARLKSVPATVTAVTIGPPLELTVTAAVPNQALPQTDVRAYVHLLRGTFDAERVTADRWRIVSPSEEMPSYDLWRRLVDSLNGSAAMMGSPVILFPPHKVDLYVTPPVGFTTGIVTLGVVAADGASYVASPVLPVADGALAGATGNESARADVIVSLHSAIPPDAPNVTPYAPNARLWASTAAVYVEAAQFELTWSSVGRAVRYEVLRALEGAIAGATPASTDAELRTLAVAQPAAFEVRSDRVFKTTYVDDLPGRAPTRALYRVRGVSAAGIAGPPSAVIGPVYIPDVRPPPPPNVLRATAAAPAEADRAIAIEWTQAGPTADLRFEIFARPDVDGTPYVLAGTLPRGTPSGAAGRFRFVHAAGQPGQRMRYRVESVREALDPIDPMATARRDIRSLPSEDRVACAISSVPLGAPSDLVAAKDGAEVVLTWANQDGYERIEIRRKAPGRRAFATIANVEGIATQYRDPTVTAGTWQYELRAIAFRRTIRSPAPAEVTIL
jgi:hypothetical protein